MSTLSEQNNDYTVRPVTPNPTVGVVINSCYGGFQLPNVTMRRYLLLSGIDYIEEEDGCFYTWTEFGKEQVCIDTEDLKFRSNPNLVRAVRETIQKPKDNTPASNIIIVQIEKGTQYRIREYDGFESIEIFDKRKWAIA